MKKHITCHYKNRALLFCTIEAFQHETAHKILNIFNAHGLTSILEQNSKSFFQIIGRMHVDYDPFVNGTQEWEEVLAQMKCTKNELEDILKPFLDESLINTNAGIASQGIQDQA